MKTLKKEREVLDAIWADHFKSGDSGHRTEAVRRGELSALLKLGIRIGP